jgi:acyl-CoA synthetase (AMP-forming)/AMP-acid ligase II
VGLLSYNCTEFLETIFAANFLGAIAMPINWRLAAPEVRYILDHSEARALVCDEELVELANDATKGMEATLVCVWRSRRPTGWTASPTSASRPARPRPHAAADDVHRLMYTSGTTGHPKGVMLTHANLAWKNLAHIVEFSFTSADLGLACGPLYHVGALDLTTTSLIAAGATTIIHRAFDAAAVVDELERSRVSTVWLAPAMLNAIMALPDVERRDLSSVRVIINGGEKMPIPLIERIQRTFPLAWFAGLRPHRVGLRRHVPRPRQHHHQARQRRPPVPAPRARHLGRAGALRPAAGGPRSCCVGPRSSRATGATRRDRQGVRRWLVPHR